MRVTAPNFPEIWNVFLSFGEVDMTEPWLAPMFVPMNMEDRDRIGIGILKDSSECPRAEHGPYHVAPFIVLVEDRVKPMAQQRYRTAAKPDRPTA
jgi:hypothetical protein